MEEKNLPKFLTESFFMCIFALIIVGIAAHGWIGELVTAIIGAVVVLWIFC